MARTLADVIKEVLADDNKVSKYEAKVIRELIMADGVVSDEERSSLEKALHTNEFDDEARTILSGLLLRDNMKD